MIIWVKINHVVDFFRHWMNGWNCSRHRCMPGSEPGSGGSTNPSSDIEWMDETAPDTGACLDQNQGLGGLPTLLQTLNEWMKLLQTQVHAWIRTRVWGVYQPFLRHWMKGWNCSRHRCMPGSEPGSGGSTNPSWDIEWKGETAPDTGACLDQNQGLGGLPTLLETLNERVKLLQTQVHAWIRTRVWGVYQPFLRHWMKGWNCSRHRCIPGLVPGSGGLPTTTLPVSPLESHVCLMNVSVSNI